MPARLAIIANPTAGAGPGRASRHRLFEAASHELQRSGFEVDLLPGINYESVRDLAEHTTLAGYSRLVAAGGDGTVNAVVNGMMRAKARGADLDAAALGVLPLGSGNVFAHNLNLPKTWRENCRVIKNGATRRVDVGLAISTPPDGPRLERHFLLMAGVGFDAKVIEDTSLRLKYVLRDFAYAIHILSNAVLHRGTRLTLRFDDGEPILREAWLVMVGNAASYAWDIRFTAEARLDDGNLDVCLMPYENKLSSIQQTVQILTGQHLERGSAEYWKVRSVSIVSEPPVPVQLDGDEWSNTPIDISISPGALTVCAPAPTLFG